MESSILQGDLLRARIGLMGVILVAGCLGANAATYYVMVRRNAYKIAKCITLGANVSLNQYEDGLDISNHGGTAPPPLSPQPGSKGTEYFFIL
jgi:hypothetical protein